MNFQIDDIDFSFWDIESDDFPGAKHFEEIDDVMVCFDKSLSFGIEMDNALFHSRYVHPYNVKVIVVGTWCPQQFWNGWLNSSVNL